MLRSPHWSSDGKFVVYEKVVIRPRPQNLRSTTLGSRARLFAHRCFPGPDPRRQAGPDGEGRHVFHCHHEPRRKRQARCLRYENVGPRPQTRSHGMAGAFNPTVSPDGAWIAFGLGEWFQARNERSARIMRISAMAPGWKRSPMVRSIPASPSIPPMEGISSIASGARTRRVCACSTWKAAQHVLTNGYDNLPSWSPDGSRILFTAPRRGLELRYLHDTSRRSDLLRVTTSRAIDVTVWYRRLTADARSCGTAECMASAMSSPVRQHVPAIRPDFIMNADGSGKRMITDSRWEDSMPLYIPASLR